MMYFCSMNDAGHTTKMLLSSYDDDINIKNIIMNTRR
jgi:hypothetical protein